MFSVDPFFLLATVTATNIIYSKIKVQSRMVQLYFNRTKNLQKNYPQDEKPSPSTDNMF